MSTSTPNLRLRRIDPIEVIRGRPEMYLPFGRVSGPDLMTTLVSEAVKLSGAEVISRHLEDWWIVASPVDWTARFHLNDITSYFHSILPDPDGAPNALCGAIRLVAFARDVVTQSADQSTTIQGVVSYDEAIWRYARAHPEWHRIIAFRMEE